MSELLLAIKNPEEILGTLNFCVNMGIFTRMVMMNWGLPQISLGVLHKRLLTYHFITVIQDGSDGKNIVFHVDHLEEILKIVKPRKRRQMSKEQRLAAIERLRKYRVTVDSILKISEGLQ